MRILISHLTRMKAGYICVAGLDLNNRKHVRPVIGGRLGVELLLKNGGVFEIGAMIDLGPTRFVGTAPEVEDHQFNPGNLKLLGMSQPRDFWDMIHGESATDLATIFGPSLALHGRACAVDLNQGAASLGCLALPRGSSLYVDPYDKIRLRLNDGTFAPALSITDLRLYEDDQETPRHRLIRILADRLVEEDVLLSVGLSRAWKKPRDTESRHWLQVNNLHFKDDPLGRRAFS